MTKRIQIYGGPGCGKSTAAHKIMHHIRMAGYTAEFVQEYVKLMAYTKAEVDPLLDQAVISGRQLEAELNALRCGCDVVVSESPVLLGALYCETATGRIQCRDLAIRLSQDYPTLHILLERGKKEFVEEGRWGDHAQARDIDGKIANELETTNNVKRFAHDDFGGMTDEVDMFFRVYPNL